MVKKKSESLLSAQNSQDPTLNGKEIIHTTPKLLWQTPRTLNFHSRSRANASEGAWQSEEQQEVVQQWKFRQLAGRGQVQNTAQTQMALQELPCSCDPAPDTQWEKASKGNLGVDNACPPPADGNTNTLPGPAAFPGVPLSWPGPKIHRHQGAPESCTLLRRLGAGERGISCFKWNGFSIKVLMAFLQAASVSDKGV